MDDEMRKEVLGEVLMDELKAIREYVQDIPEIKHNVAILKEDVAELKSDMKVVKSVVRDHSLHHQKHDLEITQLKQKLA